MAEICSQAESGTSDQNGNMGRPRNKPVDPENREPIRTQAVALEVSGERRSDELKAPGYENVGHGGRQSSITRPNRAVFQRTSAVSITRIGCEMGTAYKDPAAPAACSDFSTSTGRRERAAGTLFTSRKSAPVAAVKGPSPCPFPTGMRRGCCRRDSPSPLPFWWERASLRPARSSRVRADFSPMSRSTRSVTPADSPTARRTAYDSRA